MKKYLFILILLYSCIEPYNFEGQETRKILVIDATVTNLPGEQMVRLEYSYELDGVDPEFVTGASVFITDNLGNSEPFMEVGSGLYQPDPSFVGIVGRHYQLTIETSEGTQYQSSQEELLEPATIDNIYGQFLALRSETSDGFDRGVQFLVDIDGVDENIHNYRFEYVKDYEIEVPYGSLLVYNAETNTIDPREPSIKLCYIKEPSETLDIATTSGQTTNVLREYPIVFLSEDEPDLLGKFSLTLKNYRISSAAYQYCKDLKENNESAGSFFDRQKGSLVGNIQNTSDLSEPVLGYFEVAGITETYQIFEAGTWRDEGFRADAILGGCANLIDTVQTIDILNGNVDFGTNLIYNFASTEAILEETGYNVQTLLIPNTCADCRIYGTLQKPEFWD